MIESSKYNRENYPRKCFWTQERETGVIFNPGLSADRPSNNWAQLFKEFQIVQDYGWNDVVAMTTPGS